MIADIVHEILKFLYLCPEENGGALLARRVVFSEKKYKTLASSFEKPIVFEVVILYIAHLYL